MAKPLDKWLNTDAKKYIKMNIGDLSNTFFFRDPSRSSFVNNEYFFSPADGTILYQKFIQDCNEPIIEIKGINYNLKDVMGDPDYDQPSLVIGIFLSFYDVHINRIPYGGILTYESMDCIESTNKPMLAVEKDLLNKVINPNNMEYLKNNERMFNKIYSPSLDYEYYVIQIADEDIDVICPFKPYQNALFTQNERFSLVRWGSQVELVLPLSEKFNFELCQPDTYHVEGGLDELVRIIKN
jgi:phosphatidylserine decarboxylase